MMAEEGNSNKSSSNDLANESNTAQNGPRNDVLVKIGLVGDAQVDLLVSVLVLSFSMLTDPEKYRSGKQL